MLTSLTGKGYDDWDVAATVDRDKYLPAEASYRTASMIKSKDWPGDKFIVAAIGLLSIVSLAGLKRSNKKS